MVMGGRETRGWLRVEAEGVKTKRQLERWVARGVAFAARCRPSDEARDAVTRLDSLEHFEREHEAAYRDMPPVTLSPAPPASARARSSTRSSARRREDRQGTARHGGHPGLEVPGARSRSTTRPASKSTSGSGKAAKRGRPVVKDQLVSGRPSTCTCLWYCVHAQSTASRTRRPTSSRRSAAAAVDRRPHPGPRARGRRRRGVRDRGPLLLDEHRANVTASSPIRTLALTRRVGAHEFPPFGLRDLVDETYRLLPRR